MTQTELELAVELRNVAAVVRAVVAILPPLGEKGSDDLVKHLTEAIARLDGMLKAHEPTGVP